MLGLYASAGVSLWRLIQHDFGDAGGANMKPALLVLYSLAAAQGLLFGSKYMYGLRSSTRLPKFAADGPAMLDKWLLAEYLEETVSGCEKDPSFATGRNLVTYGMELMMEAKSNEGFLAGIRVLGAVIKDDSQPGRKVLVKHLLTRSDSSSHIIRRLLQTVGPKSPYSTEIRTHAARIVALGARGIRLEQFPGLIECISSVLDPSADKNYIQQRHNYIQQRGNYSQQPDNYIQQGDNYIFSSLTSTDIESQLKKDYPRFSLLEDFDLQYLQEDHPRPAGSSDFSLSSPIEKLMQALRGASLRKFLRRKSAESSGGNQNEIQLCNTGPADAGSGTNQRAEIQSYDTDHADDAGLDGLLEEAVKIIHRLAVDEENRRIMTNAVLHKFAMAPLKLHGDNHDVILKNYWVQWLVAAIKETSRQWQTLVDAPYASEDDKAERERRSSMVDPVHGIAINSIKCTIKSIFDCIYCGAKQKKQAIQILLYLSLDMSYICMLMDSNGKRSDSKKRRLMWILLLIIRSTDDVPNHWIVSSFTHKDYISIIKHLACQKLSSMLESSGGNSDELVVVALKDLTEGFTDPRDMLIRTHATIILEGLCVSYGQYYYAKELQETLVHFAPNVVKDILISTLDERLRKALVSLCRNGYMEREGLRTTFQEIASEICEGQGKSFEYFKSVLV